MRKYVLILATPNGGDVVTAVFTSKPNGLTETPPCNIGDIREGYFVGIPGGTLSLPTWVEFSSIKTLDSYDLALHVSQGRTQLIQQQLDGQTFCAVLRCALRSQDIENRQARWIADTVATLNCP